jgi:protein-tyrosine phosphatase
MDLIQVDDSGLLYISPVIDRWDLLEERGIDVVIDLDGGLDAGIPNLPDHCVYVYLPIYDEQLPNHDRLDAVASLGAQLVCGGHRVLSHCGMGYNRSALMAGLILTKLGMSGEAAIARLRERRPGALFNDIFADHLRSVPASPLATTVRVTV